MRINKKNKEYKRPKPHAAIKLLNVVVISIAAHILTTTTCCNKFIL